MRRYIMEADTEAMNFDSYSMKNYCVAITASADELLAKDYRDFKAIKEGDKITLIANNSGDSGSFPIASELLLIYSMAGSLITMGTLHSREHLKTLH